MLVIVKDEKYFIFRKYWDSTLFLLPLQLLFINQLFFLENIRYIRMEDCTNFNLTQKLGTTLTHLKLKSQNIDQVAAHCRQDHITPHEFDQRKNKSCYRSNFSPPKLFPNYNHPIPEKQLQDFRKNQSSTLLLPSILNNSQYQASFKQKNQEKITKSKEKQSWFLKGDWAMKPASDYQENYNTKNGNQFNKTNNLRSNHSTLTIFKLRQCHKGVSSYDKDFKAYLLKKEAKLSIGDRDHLNSKENHTIETGITEYQRRYDSVFEFAPKKQAVASFSSKSNIIKRTTSKLQ